MNKISSVEERVKEFNKVFPLPRILALSGGKGVERDKMNNWLTQALQAQRDAGAREERVNIIEIVRFTKFRDNEPQEPYHKYLQQTKGVDYIRNKILKALTPPTK